MNVLVNSRDFAKIQAREIAEAAPPSLSDEDRERLRHALEEMHIDVMGVMGTPVEPESP